MRVCPTCGWPIPRTLPQRTHMEPAEILALRRALGESQRAFGAAVGVSRLTVMRWERGVFKPGAAAVRALAARKQTLTRLPEAR